MEPKKILKTSLWYFTAAMVFGVLYREIIKFTNFSGRTTLSVVHTHLLALGMIVFLILFVLSLNDKFKQHKNSFGAFFITYNIALLFMVGMLIARGLIQVFGISLSRQQDAMIAGISGLSHILILIAFIMFFRFLFKLCNSKA